jgi:hypothetical protein
MNDWDRIFSETAPGILNGAIQMGQQLGEAGYRWEVSKYFLGWGVPVYLAALHNALGQEEAGALIPAFLGQLESAIRHRAEQDDLFPENEFLLLVESIRNNQLWLESAGEEDEEEQADQESEIPKRPEGDIPMEFLVAETAYNIVRVAFTVGYDQFQQDDRGEAATWLLAASSSSFLRGLELSLGEEEAERVRPGFFSRLRHELREQYQEIEGYPLSHFLEIAASIGKKWLQLTTHNAPDAN